MDIIRQTNPRYITIENSAELLNLGMGTVLQHLSDAGYDAEWCCFSGSQFGFPTLRKRLYIIAYPMCRRRKNAILQPPGTYSLLQTWAPTEAFIRVSTSRANGFRDITHIRRGDVVPFNRFFLHAIGNAVMPAIAEHVFHCIKHDYEQTLQNL